MSLISPRARFAVTVAIVTFSVLNALAAKHIRAPEARVIGTWIGQSICTGNRPACKNEEVVYRFIAVPGKPDTVTLYADRVLAGQRIPMYKLDFVYDAVKGTLSGEFTRRQTHGVWRYQLSGDVLEGDLMILPGKEIGRKVKVHRVAEDKVPKAPPLTDYEG